MLRASLAAALLSLAVVPVAVPRAHADDGVTVDERSPSAKEYAIPLDEARTDATGGASRSRSGDAPVPFGQGVTTPERSSPSSGEPAGKSTKKDRPSKQVRTTTEPSSSSSDADPTRTVAAQPAGGDSGSSSGQALAGGAALVIVAGGAAGLWARRRQPAGEPG